MLFEMFHGQLSYDSAVTIRREAIENLKKIVLILCSIDPDDTHVHAGISTELPYSAKFVWYNIFWWIGHFVKLCDS